MAFQNASGFPVDRRHDQDQEGHLSHLIITFSGVVIQNNVCVTGQMLGSPRDTRVPQAYKSVHATSHQQVVFLTKVVCLYTFVGAEDRLVAGRPGLGRPAELDLLGPAFAEALCDLPNLLVHVGGRLHTAWTWDQGIALRRLESTL